MCQLYNKQKVNNDILHYVSTNEIMTLTVCVCSKVQLEASLGKRDNSTINYKSDQLCLYSPKSQSHCLNGLYNLYSELHPLFDCGKTCHVELMIN